MSKSSSKEKVPKGSDAELVPMWSTQQVSEFLGVPVSTLHQWSHLGVGGPPVYRVGRYLRYFPHEVRQWLVEECRREAS